MINLLWIFAFTFFFALFDYFGYNEFTKRGLTKGLLAPYRIAQMSVQIILIAVAWAFIDIIVAIGFTIMWWTWCCDWIFHLGCFTDLYNDKQYVSRGEKEFTKCISEKDFADWRKKFMEKDEYKCVLYWNKQIKWAWWTPLGLVDWLFNGKNGDSYRVIHWSKLAFQSLIGIIITIILCLK